MVARKQANMVVYEIARFSCLTNCHNYFTLRVIFRFDEILLLIKKKKTEVLLFGYIL